jgi:alkanesulfonate monooxygenase SsuD/methylene tetrahydromethanopterin reductase-like flavin-dependent oxidoreductase (luciferase family)
MMKYGFVLPSGDARTAADFAYEAEAADWDGFFVWEPVWGIDAWVALTAAAMRTERIRLGTLLTPLSRMRPWKLASETATLDQLSNGRVILSVGLGAPDTGFESFGEVTDRKTRAELLDEGLDILTGLWRGQPFNYSGKHYQIKETSFQPPPPPVQQPRIPIWVVGAWPRKKSMRRVLRYDGLLPAKLNDDGSFAELTPADIQAMKAFVDEHRSQPTPFDIVMEGTTPGDDPEKAAAILRPWAEAGATWWIESHWEAPRDAEGRKVILQRIRQGPPRLNRNI